MLSTKLKAAAGNSADATLYVDDVFSTYLYTGNGSTQTINNGIDLAGKGGMVWTKSRSTTYPHSLIDSARGIINGNENVLNSSTTAGNTLISGMVISANSNGFTTGGAYQINENNQTYASWTFRKAAKFFDVVTYTGTGSARTIAHSLGVAPGMMIVKRTDTTGDWQVYSNGLTSAAYSIQLNLTNAQASAPTVWNSTAPTSSVFSVGTDATVNASGGTYVAYLFAHNTASDGIIQCGSVTSDVNRDAMVTLGWEPQYILFKSTTRTGNWTVTDSMRGLLASINGTDQPSAATLYPNLSNAEAAGGQAMGINATGFKQGRLAVAGDTYIYMAIRRPNKPPTTGTQVYNAQRTASTTNPQTVTTGFVTDLALRQDPSSGAPTWFNRLTGPALFIQSSNTNAETNPGVNGFNCDKMNGWSDASSGVGVQRQYWGFKRAPGFMDVVCYTGSASTLNVNHNLGVVPELIIAKTRSTTSNWMVYSATLGNAKALLLNDTSGQVSQPSVWNSTTPTSTIVTLGGGSQINSASVTSVMYLFATLAGISKVGSYTGNGGTQNIECGFAAGARFFLVKATSTTGSWWVWDSARGITAGNDPALQLNSTAAEITTADAVDPYSPGITVNQEATCSINANGVSYIFLAVA